MGSPCKLPSASVALPPGLGGFLSVPAEEAQEHRVTSQSLSCGAGCQQVTDWGTLTLPCPVQGATSDGLVDLLNRPLHFARRSLLMMTTEGNLSPVPWMPGAV